MPLKSPEEDGGVDYHLAVSREYQKYLVVGMILQELLENDSPG